MRSNNTITRFINKHGRNRWLKMLHKRMDRRARLTRIEDTLQEILKEVRDLQARP